MSIKINDKLAQPGSQRRKKIERRAARNVKMTGPDEHGSVYIYVQSDKGKKAAQTVPLESASVIVDFDDNGDLLGIELLGVMSKNHMQR